MRSHGRRTVSRCFATLRQLCIIWRQVPTAVFQSLVTALVLPYLDYCNSVLYGLPTWLIRRLQSVRNATAWLIFGLRHHFIKTFTTMSGGETILIIGSYLAKLWAKIEWNFISGHGCNCNPSVNINSVYMPCYWQPSIGASDSLFRDI